MHTAFKSAALALGVLVTLLIAQVAAPDASAAFADTDGDGFSGQAEQVFGSNALVAASVPESSGFPILFHTDVCHDGIDNDLDGSVDSADPGCADSDADLFSDEIEQQFGAPTDDADYYPEASALDNALISLDLPIQFCADGRDDDDDGLVDAADSGCTDIDSDGDGFSDLTEKTIGSDTANPTSVPEHETFNPGSCSDGADNDIDGAIDAVDDGCVAMPNDDIADAFAIASLPFTQTTKVLNATIQPSERMSDCVLEEEGNTVWYRYTPDQNQTVVLDTSGTDYTTIIAVWQEGTFGLSQVTCANGFGFYAFDPQSRLAFQAEAGQTYYVQIGAESTFYKAAGRLVLTATIGSPPANDNIGAATSVAQLPYNASVNTIAATVESFEPSSSCLGDSGSTAQNTVWYAYTPANDVYLSADTGGSDFIGQTVAVYTRTANGALLQEGCGYLALPFYYTDTSSRLAFLAQAGQTYFIQAGGAAFGGFNQSGTAQAKGGAAGFSFGSTGGNLMLTLENFTPPSCPPEQQSYPDPLGDGSFGETPSVDINRLGVAKRIGQGQPGSVLCLTVGLNNPVAPDAASVAISFDTDLDRETGYDDLQYSCAAPPGLGADLSAAFEPEAGLLVPIANLSGELAGVQYGFATLEGSVYHIALPLEALGDDVSFRFALIVRNDNDFTSDCAPNGGNITCEGGPCSFVPFRNGDADCVGGSNAIDAAIVLQYGAGLLAALSCPDAADVTGDERIDSRDAALILQYSAGLLAQLPPFFNGPIIVNDSQG